MATAQMTAGRPTRDRTVPGLPVNDVRIPDRQVPAFGPDAREETRRCPSQN